MTAKYETFRLYHSDGGEQYHRNPGCAVHQFENPLLDGGEDLFDQCEMVKVGEIKNHSVNLCDRCITTSLKEYIEQSE